MQLPGNAADPPKAKFPIGETIPIVIDGQVFDKSIDEAIDIAMTILTIARIKLSGKRG